MSLASLPPEILLCIRDELRSEADRQCLRATNRRLRNILPLPVIVDDGDIVIIGWKRGSENIQYLHRLFQDMPAHEKQGKVLCERCHRVVKWKVVRRGVGRSVITECQNAEAFQVGWTDKVINTTWGRISTGLSRVPWQKGKKEAGMAAPASQYFPQGIFSKNSPHR